MSRAVLLRCPVCNSARALEGNRDNYSNGELCATAHPHLRTHRLDESSTAIRKHQIANQAVELIVSPADLDRLPTAAWQKHTATWLPDDRVLRVNSSETPSDSSSEKPPRQSSVEN
jgi:hypothetical protein